MNDYLFKNKSIINIITFNIYYKTILNKLKYCEENKCIENLVKFLTFDINKYVNNNFDFILLQEISNNDNKKTQVDILRDNINKLNPNFFNIFNYNNVRECSKPTGGVLTLYNKIKYELIDYVCYDTINRCGIKHSNNQDIRPCVVELYKNIDTREYIIVINVHFPHDYKIAPPCTIITSYELINELLNKIKKKYNIKKCKTIIGGDFNKDVNKYSDYIYNNLKMIDSNFKNSLNEKHHTCCYNTDGFITKANYWFDLIISNFGNIKYIDPDMSEYQKKGYSTLSDHKPIIAIIDDIDEDFDNFIKTHIYRNMYNINDQKTHMESKSFYDNLINHFKLDKNNINFILTNGANEYINNIGSGTTRAINIINNNKCGLFDNLKRLYDIKKVEKQFDFFNKYELKNQIVINKKYYGDHPGTIYCAKSKCKKFGNNIEYNIIQVYHIKSINLNILPNNIENISDYKNHLKLVYTILLNDLIKIKQNPIIIHIVQTPGYNYGGSKLTAQIIYNILINWIGNNYNNLKNIYFSIDL